MPAGRKKGDHEARRMEIAEAACRVIVKAGLERAGLADIARELGYSTGVVMHYYRSKEQLLLYAKNLSFDRAYERARQAGQDAEPAHKLRAMALELLPLDAPSIDRLRVLAAFNGMAIGNAALMAMQNKRNLWFVSLFEDAIQQLQTAAALPRSLQPRLEALGIMAYIDGLAAQVIAAPKSWSRAQILTLMDGYLARLGGACTASARGERRPRKAQR